jgi:hypothetical protein
MKAEIYRLPLVLPLDPFVLPGETFLINSGASATSIFKSGDAMYYLTQEYDDVRGIDMNFISNEKLDHQSRSALYLGEREVFDFTVYSDPTAATPEPSTLVVSGVGLGLLLAARKKRLDPRQAAPRKISFDE